MNTVIKPVENEIPSPSAAPPPAVADDDPLLNDLVDELFFSLTRSDQRRKGMDYLRGLLSTPGRKSVRNMAAALGGAGTGQSLHHFVCSSTWEWSPVRRALARYTMRESPPQAWVVRPLVIPKVGRHSVGVSRYFSADLGQVVNAQRAVGVWLASDHLSVPVEWRLHLPGRWRGSLDCGTPTPAMAQSETLVGCAAEASLAMIESWGLPPRPVILDLDDTDPLPAFRRLCAAGLRPAARIRPELPLRVTDPALIGHRGRTLPAELVMRAGQELRRPVPDPADPARRARLVAAVRVTRPSTAPSATGTAPEEELLLVGIGRGGRPWPQELWLIRPPESHAGPAALWASGLVDRVERSFARFGDPVGMRDYAGRSFNGWHRHITLASVAHTFRALSPAAEARARPTTVPAAT
ncbi:IS701 family transposase [Nocardiopsis lambiniae]|uniref:Transposase n=1 Tax=Nocardiopsis lambiniae TaxID=3075539 RepID=A0ABU2MB93_9ACTN|nr:transposase [Nocardiopsis sp. DSM 44743]MDT0329516.1 transposase [Nocardiopsis sp. DSM 44743]